MGTGKAISTGFTSPNKAKADFLLRFFHAFNGNECVIVYHFVKWGLGSGKFDHSPLDGSGLCPLPRQLHHSMFSVHRGLRCTRDE